MPMKENQIRIPFLSLFFIFGSQVHAISGTKNIYGSYLFYGKPDR